MGKNVGAPDGVPFGGFVSRSDGREVAGPEAHLRSRGHQVDRAVCAAPVAAWTEDHAGGRSGDRRNQARGICSRQARLAATIRKVYAPAERFRLETSSDVFGDVRERLAALGVPAHGSSLKTVWGV